MRVLVAPDKFKGTLTAAAAAAAIAKGLHRARPDWECTAMPLSDGGEGFVEALVAATGGRRVWMRTTDAAGRAKRASFGILGDGRTAVVGLTEASALADLPPSLRDPGKTSNEGTGRILAEVIRRGFRQVIVALGGSATTEGGIGLAAPLGFQFLDDRGRAIPLTGNGLARLARIVPAKLPAGLRITVATDVIHPLYGRNGAAFCFAPQKGASPAAVRKLDQALRRLARIAQRDLGRSFHERAGAGAAGGCGYGLMTFLRAAAKPGFEVLREALRLDEAIRRHDLVVTGEGCLDETSLMGKAPVRLGKLARRLGRPCWAFAGRAALPEKGLPFGKVRGMVAGSVSATEAQRRPAYWLSRTVEAAARES